MSGIEVLGLVLGALPLVLSGLEHYGEAPRAIRSIMDYHREFAALFRTLRMENEILRNTMELMLADRAQESMVVNLLAAPDGDG